MLLYAGEVKAAREKPVGRASSPAWRSARMLLIAAMVPWCSRGAELAVTVRTGATPIPRSRVTLMRAGSAKGAARLWR